MPRIDDRLLNSVLYIYKTGQDAKEGVRSGGSGFLVAVKSMKHPHHAYAYAVTNRHVIDETGTPAIRMNKKDGGVDIIPSFSSNWVKHPDGDDIAITCLSGNLNVTEHCCIDASIFINKQIINENNIGPGNETFMIGRFISHDGKQRNQPSVQFGNISMMPVEKIRLKNMYEQECFLVQTQSLSGFSGSPVFVQNPPFRFQGSALELGGSIGPWLLGLDCGHMNIYTKIKEKKERKYKDIPQDWYSENNSGRMIVIPAWKIHDMLFQGILAENRESEEEKLCEIEL